MRLIVAAALPAFLALLALLAPPPAAAAAVDRARLEAWLETQLWPRAQKAGIERTLFVATFADLQPHPGVLRQARRQPEFTFRAGDYMNRLISATRIARGRDRRRRYADLLAELERRYGVDAAVLLAIWGVESDYGRRMGDNDVVAALATLGAAGRRENFVARELIALLSALQQGLLDPASIKGSWSGAIGHTQFIPSSYLAYGVDFDGDGKVGLSTSVPDALASTANYLVEAGWRRHRDWGFAVRLSDAFRREGIEPGRWATIEEWRRKGVRAVDPAPLRGAEAMTWRLILPEGFEGPAFLAGKNFDAVLRYNRALFYALAIGLLADRIAGDDAALTFPLTGPPRPLSSAQKRNLQRHLQKNGFAVGDIDGIIGVRTQKAIIAYQRANGLPADGHADRELFAHITGRREPVAPPPRPAPRR